ncbi:hypothetical protein [Streptomyces sp. 142MFCol3.1]|uniref:hypothetical protein n=1 Tax=Streptomyces sp. 142MFCol3.1 TaxID=1172179 RepID=UPI000404D9B8|nr:hypothetical protein [Streptomyces sp. 142MFCol3.1]
MRTAAGETAQPCPECGAEIRCDSRFAVWCAACDSARTAVARRLIRDGFDG